MTLLIKAAQRASPNGSTFGPRAVTENRPIRGHFQQSTHFCPFRHGLAQLQRLNRVIGCLALGIRAEIAGPLAVTTRMNRAEFSVRSGELTPKGWPPPG